MASPFELFVRNLDQLGFFGFLLPWILTFAVLYALLLKTKALGDDQKIIGVVSMVAAFFVIGFGGVALGMFFKSLFGTMVMVLAGILITMMFVGMSGYDISKLADSKLLLTAGLGIGAIVFFSVFGGLELVTKDVMSIIFIVVVMIVAVMFIAGGAKAAAGH
ncbi:MAG: hypothetical protein J4431_04225 [Candidatus Aenigmarchaeota archaeon]|nr:hypothetical protein [Candidatus Aenigmarchaeota archaeon]